MITERHTRRAPILETIAFLILYGALSAPLLWPPGSAFGPVASSLALATALAVLSAVDLDRHRLPDLLTLPLAVVGLGVAWWSAAMPLWWSAVSAMTGFALLAVLGLVYRYVRGRAGLGLGDAKLLGASGAWLGLEGLPTVLLWATGAAIACALISHWRGNALSPSTRLPFGPFLAFATWLVWLYGPL